MSDKKETAKKISIPMIIIGVVMCFAVAIFGGDKEGGTVNTTAKAKQTKTTAVTEQKQTELYTFRTKKSLNEHFKKHGADTYCKSEEEYLQKANDVINNPEAMTKTEAEDGDRVFYIEGTDEIVFLSTDGYIRTYFICSGKDYFDRQ